MPTTYTQAPDDVKELVASTIADYYPDLKTAGVTIGILMAERRNEEGDLTEESALKLHGYPCAATAKVNSLKDRAEGKPDATITICGNTWADRSTPTQAAIVDRRS